MLSRRSRRPAAADPRNAPQPITAGWSSPVARQAHNLKVVGSNPTPATNFLRVIKRLSAALRGGVCVSNIRGSTVEARGREVLDIAAKSASPRSPMLPDRLRAPSNPRLGAHARAPLRWVRRGGAEIGGRTLGSGWPRRRYGGRRSRRHRPRPASPRRFLPVRSRGRSRCRWCRPAHGRSRPR